MKNRQLYRLTLGLLMLLALAGCGGGGAAGGTDPAKPGATAAQWDYTKWDQADWK